MSITSFTPLFLDALSNTTPSLFIQAGLIFALFAVLITKELVRIITPCSNHTWIQTINVIVTPLLLIFCIIIGLNTLEIMAW